MIPAVPGVFFCARAWRVKYPVVPGVGDGRQPDGTPMSFVRTSGAPVLNDRTRPFCALCAARRATRIGPARNQRAQNK